MLLTLGLLDTAGPLAVGLNGVLVGMVYIYILFMLFPLYNAIESLDRNQIEAARDLGAPSWRIHWRIVIPHAKPGIAVGCIMVFMLAASSYVVPALLGSPGTRWFTEIIYQWFFEGQDWPRGSAYAFLLLILCVRLHPGDDADLQGRPDRYRQVNDDPYPTAAPRIAPAQVYPGAVPALSVPAADHHGGGDLQHQPVPHGDALDAA